MRRKGILSILFAALLVLAAAITVYANDINVTVDGEAVVFPDSHPAIIDGRTLVPVRAVFETMGFDVEWNAIEHRAYLNNDDFEVIISIGSEVFTVNGASHTLDVPAQIIGGSTMLPIRAILENVGFYVGWDAGSSTVIVSSTPLDVVETTPPTANEPTQDTTEQVQRPVAFTSYQQVLDYFTARLQEAAPAVIADFRLAAANASNLDMLIDLSLEHLDILATISVEGTLAMADLLILQGIGNEDIYMQYAERLSAVYLEESARLTEVFIELSLAL